MAVKTARLGSFDRRRFVAGVGTTLLGCDGALPQIDAVGNEGQLDSGVDLSSGSLDAAPQEIVDATLPPTCGALTEANIEGPFFRVSSPERSTLREAGMSGVVLVISGRVLATDCTPLAGALLDFWQADAAGAYDIQGYILRGHQFADAQGRYRLETIVPGRYLNGATYRPAHIHVKVSAQGTGVLTTQLYFEGDPYNGSDTFIRSSLILDPQDAADGSKTADFDFVLTGA